MRLEKITQRNKIGKTEEGLEINPQGPQHLMVQQKRKCWKRNFRKQLKILGMVSLSLSQEGNGHLSSVLQRR